MSRYLVGGDSNGMSDPYCVVRILDKEMKTSVKSNCSNGIWNQSLIFIEISFDISYYNG